MASCLTNASRVFEFIDTAEEPNHYENIAKPTKDAYITMEHVDFLLFLFD